MPAMAEIPDTRYAKTSDGAHIAFQTFGSGDIDLLYLPGYYSNLDANWDIPEIADLLQRLGTFARVIAIDRRGIGLSDRMAPGSTEPLETHVDDILGVLDAVHADQACVFAYENATALAVSLAATHPTRVRALALFSPLPAPWGVVSAGWEDIPPSERPLIFAPETWRDELDRSWGTGWARAEYEMFVPSVAGDGAAIARWAKYLRSSASPESAITEAERWFLTDIRGVYPAVQAETLLLFRPQAHPAYVTKRLVEEAAAEIPNARVVELPGRDLPCWFGDRERIAAELQGFFTGTRSNQQAIPDRILATVLFTDIVGSTEKQAALGDAGWKDLVLRHHAIVRDALGTWRGVENDTAGDGFYATFDGPARAIHCALQVIRNVHELGIEVRAGIHTGECELVDGKMAGISVSIGARVAALAAPSEVLVSQTVKDLVAGSGLTFEDAGEHELKGVPDRWHLYRVVDA